MFIIIIIVIFICRYCDTRLVNLYLHRRISAFRSEPNERFGYLINIQVGKKIVVLVFFFLLETLRNTISVNHQNNVVNTVENFCVEISCTNTPICIGAAGKNDRKKN